MRVLPDPDSTLGVALRHATSASNALATVFAQATPADIHEVWLAGQEIKDGPSTTTAPTPQEAAA